MGHGRAAAGVQCSRRRHGSAASTCNCVYYRGSDEVQPSAWFSDAHELIRRMSTIRCKAGATKIARVLRHIRTEHEREKISAAIFIGDAVEEPPSELYDAAADLGVPMFLFQEGDGWAGDQPANLRCSAAEGRDHLSRARAADEWRLRQVRCRGRKAAWRTSARRCRVCSRRRQGARQPAHRQRAQAARSDEVRDDPLCADGARGAGRRCGAKSARSAQSNAENLRATVHRNSGRQPAKENENGYAKIRFEVLSSLTRFATAQSERASSPCSRTSDYGRPVLELENGSQFTLNEATTMP